MMRTTRLKDIADATGFSVNTVSLALRDSPRIPAETRDIIRRAAAALHYQPNHVARSLVSRETKTIGLIMTDILNTTLTRTAQQVELALAARGYGTLLATSNHRLSEEQRLVEMFRSRRVDGLLIYPAVHDAFEHIRALRRQFPVVLLVGGAEAGLDVVSVDDRSGARRAVGHLVALGHRRIGLLRPLAARANSEKFEGYQQALAEAGLAFDADLVVAADGHSAAHGDAALDRLMAIRTPPTAVFMPTDALAFGALRWCRRHGRRVPQDLAIMGYDNIELAEFAEPPLSTMNYAVDAVSRLAVERLMGLIAAGDPAPAPQVTLIDPELVVRDST